MCPIDLHPTSTQAGIVQLKLPSGYTKGTISRIRFSAGELQVA